MERYNEDKQRKTGPKGGRPKRSGTITLATTASTSGTTAVATASKANTKGKLILILESHFHAAGFLLDFQTL